MHCHAGNIAVYLNECLAIHDYIIRRGALSKDMHVSYSKGYVFVTRTYQLCLYNAHYSYTQDDTQICVVQSCCREYE